MRFIIILGSMLEVEFVKVMISVRFSIQGRDKVTVKTMVRVRVRVTFSVRLCLLLL